MLSSLAKCFTSELAVASILIRVQLLLLIVTSIPGMRDFEDTVTEEGTFVTKVHTVINASVQREVLELSFKQ